MRPVCPDGDGPVPLGEAGHVDAHVQHGAGALVADDVRRGRQLSAQPVQGVPAFDAYRLNPDEHIVRSDDRVGYLFDAEYLGPPGLVVHGCFHGRSPFAFRIAAPPLPAGAPADLTGRLDPPGLCRLAGLVVTRRARASLPPE